MPAPLRTEPGAGNTSQPPNSKQPMRNEMYSVSFEVVGREAVHGGGTSYETWGMEPDLDGQKAIRWAERRTRREIRWSIMVKGQEMIGEVRNE